MLAVKAEGIYKYYKSGTRGKKEVLRDVSIDINDSEIFGILGPNGAGKTTLISILSTLTIPDRGKVEIFGILDKVLKEFRNVQIMNIKISQPNLEDVFLKLAY